MGNPRVFLAVPVPVPVKTCTCQVVPRSPDLFPVRLFAVCSLAVHSLTVHLLAGRWVLLATVGPVDDRTGDGDASRLGVFGADGGVWLREVVDGRDI